ncbi:MAG: hypothetical protein EBW47_05795, partial [Betaproteobacteria bacterium]|nr:hypothetical protein [Betaproteobacteria bacterium]
DHKVSVEPTLCMRVDVVLYPCSLLGLVNATLHANEQLIEITIALQDPTEVRHLWAKKGCFGLRFGIAV